MSDNLDPDEYSGFEKSYKLVGQYLAAWAFMESRIDTAIRVGLDLNVLQGAIVCVNVGFTAKCHILQTLATLGKTKKKGVRDDVEKLFEKLKNLSVDRNMIAHNQFFPEKTKGGEFGVYFSIVKAKGNLSLPRPKWSEKTFEKNVDELYGLGERIKEIEKSLSFRKMAMALTKPLGQKPTIGRIGLGFQGLLYPQPPTDPLSDSLISTLKKRSQTPQESEE